MSRNTVAVIVTFNRLDKLKHTLQQTLEQPFYRVVVVNNHSTDGTREWLDGHSDQRLQLIHTEQNLGGAGGFHLGFEFAARKLPDAEWLVAFDDDAHPQPGMLEIFNALDVPAGTGSLAAAVYLPDGRISEMNRPSVNPFWHLRELIFTALKGRQGFHVNDEEYTLESSREVDASSFVGFFLRLSLIREKRICLPRSELFIYADDIIYILELRKAGLRHWFVPRLKFVHDCQTLVDQKDVYRPLWKVYYTFRNRLEMYRIASGIFYPLVLMVKLPKLFLAARFYEPHERRRFLAVTTQAIRDGVWRDYSKSFKQVTALSEGHKILETARAHVNRMNSNSKKPFFIRSLVKGIARRARHVMAWKYPRLYLRFMVSWKLPTSNYYVLVQSCRADHAGIPLGGSTTEFCSGHSPKRILYLIHWYELGGAESYALYTIKTAHELGHSCFCISTVPSENKERHVFEQYCVEAINYSKEETNQGFQYFVSNYIRANSIDVVHIHHSVLMYEALAAIKEKFPQLLIVDSTHIVEHWNGGFPQLSAQNSAHIDKHNVISKNLILVQKALFRQAFGLELQTSKFHLTYLSGLTEVVDFSLHDPHRQPKVVTFYGRLVLQKQPHIFVAVVEHLFATHPALSVEAHIYGEGEMEDALKERIFRSKFRNRIRFFGRCDDKKLVFESTDILLSTSLNEGLSLTAYEALSFGRLVVASDVGAQFELLCQECLIPLTPQFIENAATRLFEFLSDNDKYREALAENSRTLDFIRTQEANSAAMKQLYASNSRTEGN